MTRRGLLLLFLAAFGIFAAMRFPLVIALALTDDVAALRVEGTVWRGRLEGAAIFGRPAGDLALELSPWSLPVGRLRLDWSVGGGALAGSGTLIRTLDGTTIVRAAALEGPVSTFLPLAALAGDFRAEIDEIVLDGGHCRSARGHLWSDVPARSEALLGWRGPEIEGRITCAGEALLLPASGRSQDASLAARLLLRPGRHVRFELAVEVEDDALLHRLRALGFVPRGDAFVFEDSGRFGGP